MSETTKPVEATPTFSTPDVLSNLARALVAGLIAWGFMYQFHPVFQVPVEYHYVDVPAPAAKVAAFDFQQALADQRNATLVTAILGGLLAAAMSLGGAVCCPAWLRFLIGLLWGAVVGATAGFVGAKAHSWIAGSTVTDTIKVQTLVFSVLGAGIGVMCGALARSIRIAASGAVAGTLAGALAGMAYPVVVAMLIPSAAIHLQVPEGTAVQLVWIGALVSCVASIIPLVLTSPPRTTNVDKAG